jgi:hypothetical protein
MHGGLVGGGLGAITYRKKKVQELSQRLDDLIQFDAEGNIERLKEHAKREGTKTALESVYEKLLKSDRPRIRLSSRLDDLITFTSDPRPRDLQGQFESPGDGGQNPNAMATVYKQPQPERMGAGKFAGAALAGGALAAVGAQAGKAGWQQAAKMVKSLAVHK